MYARDIDPWFWSHYDDVANIILSIVPPDVFGTEKCRVVDFGCGDGAATLGIASRVRAQVTGVDLQSPFVHLPDAAAKNLGTRALPSNLAFLQAQSGQPLPFDDGSIDLAYSWSVFEHVENPAEALSELRRIVKPGGSMFLQIEPLFYSPYGCHLRRLVDEPWAHLKYGESDYLDRARSAQDHIVRSEQDNLYTRNDFEDVKKYLILEYEKLNRITAPALLDLISGAGFEVVSKKLITVEGLVPDERLVKMYPIDWLMTDQVVVLARKPM